MIRLFTGRRRIPFFPKKWANAVSNWCLGVNSPSGTIDIRNTANPGDGGSATFDVNIENVARAMKERLSRSFASPSQVASAISDAADGSSLLARDGRLTVNEEWLRSIAGGGGGGTVSSVDGVPPGSDGNVVLNALTDSDIGVSVAAFNHDHNGVYSPLSHTHQQYATTDALASYVTSASLQTTLAGYSRTDHTHNQYQPYNAGLATLAGNLSNGKVPLTQLTGNIYGHSGNCLVTIDNAGNLGHSGNAWYNALSEIATDYSSNNNAIPYISKLYDDTIMISSASEKYFYVEDTATGGNCHLGNGTLWLTGGNKTVYFRNYSGGNANAWVSDITGSYLEFYHASGGQSLKWDGANLALDNASICKLYQYSGGLALYGASNITLYSVADGVKLLNHPSYPSYEATSLSVPSVGWTELYFAGFDHLTYSQLADQDITLVTDVVWNGTSLVKKTVTLSTHKGIMTSSSSLVPVETVIDTPTVVSWS